MEIDGRLNTTLREQPFSDQQFHDNLLAEGLRMAADYARLESSIACLSDLYCGVSYIHYGGVGELLGIASRGEIHRINSIWEDEVLGRAHPDDLRRDQVDELRFFHFLRQLPASESPSDYHLECHLRMSDAEGRTIPILHRIYYLTGCGHRNVWFALCLFNVSLTQDSANHIINTSTGQIVQLGKQDYSDILTSRETEVLRLIDRGRQSKEIADELSISGNTVNRHRQNILAKLRVGNSIEAIRVAKELQII